MNAFRLMVDGHYSAGMHLLLFYLFITWILKSGFAIAIFGLSGKDDFHTIMENPLEIWLAKPDNIDAATFIGDNGFCQCFACTASLMKDFGKFPFHVVDFVSADFSDRGVLPFVVVSSWEEKEEILYCFYSQVFKFFEVRLGCSEFEG